MIFAVSGNHRAKWIFALRGRFRCKRQAPPHHLLVKRLRDRLPRRRVRSHCRLQRKGDLVALVLKQSRVAPADRIVAGQEFVVELDRGLNRSNLLDLMEIIRFRNFRPCSRPYQHCLAVAAHVFGCERSGGRQDYGNSGRGEKSV